MPGKKTSSKAAQEQSADVIFGQIVREKRLALGLRLIDLQSEGGLDRSHIGKIEAGKVQVCLRGIIQIAQGLETTPGELMNEVMKKIY
ncbi:MAG: helix-turn-helix transcriptional regulator [Ignavibacteriae bacterium]|nr:helix-turn-helix transcriptional regulator [Ignavibacteriota bacterium]MCB9217185.1 helix-turn-helix transcriptional regulator [Ignavibacteria bacterium]